MIPLSICWLNDHEKKIRNLKFEKTFSPVRELILKFQCIFCFFFHPDPKRNSIYFFDFDNI